MDRNKFCEELIGEIKPIFSSKPDIEINNLI